MKLVIFWCFFNRFFCFVIMQFMTSWKALNDQCHVKKEVDSCNFTFEEKRYTLHFYHSDKYPMTNAVLQTSWFLYIYFWKNTYCTFPLLWKAPNDQCHVTKELVAQSYSVEKLPGTWYTLALYYTILHKTTFHWTLLHIFTCIGYLICLAK